MMNGVGVFRKKEAWRERPAVMDAARPWTRKGMGMDSLRIVTIDQRSILEPCCRCAESERRWDRIAGKPYCPNCEELLARGEAPPLVERTERNVCAVCSQQGTVRFLSFPLHNAEPIEIDLCPEHLRCLLERRLGPHAFFQLNRQLGALGIDAEDIFLLHGTFYDHRGRALRPAVEAE